jgi:tetratricopeptide (TPR) repeat protein
LLLMAGTLMAYQPVWHAGFIWDDGRFVVNNPLIHRADGLYRFWCTTEAPDYFPLTSTTLWLEWRLWGRYPLGYHLVNVLLHALSAVLLWRLLARLKIPGAWLAAAVFALHPVNVESVAWIAERKNTLAMVFFLLSLLCYLRSDSTPRPSNSPQLSTLNSQQRWYWFSLAAFVLALLSKTAVAPLPLVLLGLAWWRRGRVARRDVWRSAPFFAAAAGMGLISLWFQHYQAIGSDPVRTDSIWSRLAGAGWAVWFYLYKALLPLNLSFVYPRWRIDARSALSYAPGALLAAGFLVCWRYRRQWGKAWLFGLGYFVVMLFPVLGFLNIYFMRYSLVADHWQYFAIIGPIALASAGVTMALGRVQSLESKVQSPRFPSPRPSPHPMGRGRSFLGATVCGALLAGLGTLTWRQCGMYADVETLWRATLAADRNCWVAHVNLGDYLLRTGRLEEATAHFREAVKIQPDYPDGHSDLGKALVEKGRLDEAFACFLKAAEYQPDAAEAHSNFGNALLRKGRLDEALVHLQAAVQIRTNYAAGHNNLGLALMRKGRVAEALAQYQTALQIQPDFADAHNNLGNALIQNGQVGEALVHYQTALQIEPDYAEAHNGLGNALLREGQVDEAVAEFQRALSLQPDLAAAHLNLADVLLQREQLDLALAHLQRAVQIQPNLAGAHNNLANVLLRKGRVDEAIAHYQQALEIRPDFVPAYNSLAWLLATSAQASVRNGARALNLAQQAEQLSGGRNAVFIGTLAAAFAETGRFPEAIASAQRALSLAAAQSNTALQDQLHAQIKLYEAGSPLRDTGYTGK